MALMKNRHKKEDGVSAVLPAAVPENALSAMRECTAFTLKDIKYDTENDQLVPSKGNVLYVGLAIELEANPQPGSLPEQFAQVTGTGLVQGGLTAKSNPDVGALVQAMKQGLIKTVTTDDFNEYNAVMIIPDDLTLANAREYGLVWRNKFTFAFVEPHVSDKGQLSVYVPGTEGGEPVLFSELAQAIENEGINVEEFMIDKEYPVIQPIIRQINGTDVVPDTAPQAPAAVPITAQPVSTPMPQPAQQPTPQQSAPQPASLMDTTPISDESILVDSSQVTGGGYQPAVQPATQIQPVSVAANDGDQYPSIMSVNDVATSANTDNANAAPQSASELKETHVDIPKPASIMDQVPSVATAAPVAAQPTQPQPEQSVQSVQSAVLPDDQHAQVVPLRVNDNSNTDDNVTTSSDWRQGHGTDMTHRKQPACISQIEQMVNTPLRRKIAVAGFDIIITSEPFDLRYGKSLPFVPFDEDRDSSALGRYVESACKAANTELARIHIDAYTQARQKYFDMMVEQANQIARSLALTGSNPYAQAYAQAQKQRDFDSSRAQDVVAARVEQLQNRYDEAKGNAVDAAAAEAARDYDNRFKSALENRVNNAPGDVHNEIETRFEDNITSLNSIRKDQFNALMDDAVSTALKSVYDEYKSASDAEQHKRAEYLSNIEQLQLSAATDPKFITDTEEHRRNRAQLQEAQQRITALSAELNRQQTQSQQALADVQAKANADLSSLRSRMDADLADSRAQLRQAQSDANKAAEMSRGMSRQYEEALGRIQIAEGKAEDAKKSRTVMMIIMIVAIVIAVILAVALVYFMAKGSDSTAAAAIDINNIVSLL